MFNEKISLLAIANYNLGCQHEFLNEFNDAIGRYELAIKLMNDNQNFNNPLIDEFKKSLK